MMLRYISVYDSNGVTTKSALQVWNEETSQWEDVQAHRASEKDEELANKSKYWY